ncbi:MAG: DNA primase [Clostridia bacterium]|nr:DNA primase [Clostridia bacterium]
MDKGFSSEWIDKLKFNNDIVTTLSKYVTLQKKGKTWWACCPFHFEKTPSFAVNEYEQYYHCFGCGASGDVIKFVEKIENIDFYDACKILAEKAGMELPEYTQDENIALKKKKVDKCYKLLKDAAKYYFGNLNDSKAQVARDYLAKRKINVPTIKAFAIGYSLGWDNVVSHLKSLGYTLEEMVEAGVVEEKNGKYYDCYANRLIFPIINTYNNVIGFSARVLEKSDYGKYKNTSQTIVFDKSKTLYGINIVKSHKQQQALNEIIIVEGQIDLISMYQAGITNAVATMGTALTAYHAKELGRFCNKVVLCFDGDIAGVKATLRSIEILVKSGLQVFCCHLPGGQDPDEFINANGKDEFYKVISGAKYWVEYLIDKYAHDYNLDKLEEKNKFVTESLNIIASLSTNSEQDIYIDRVSQLSGINKRVLRSDLENNNGKEELKVEIVEPKKVDEDSGRKENAYVKALRFVMWALLNKQDFATLSQDIKDSILDPDYLKVYEYIESQYAKNEKPIISTLFSMFDVENNLAISELISYEPSSNVNANYYKDCVKTLVNCKTQMQKDDLLQKFKNAQSNEERAQLMTKLNELIKKKK